MLLIFPLIGYLFSNIIYGELCHIEFLIFYVVKSMKFPLWFLVSLSCLKVLACPKIKKHLPVFSSLKWTAIGPSKH